MIAQHTTHVSIGHEGSDVVASCQLDVMYWGWAVWFSEGEKVCEPCVG